VLRSRKPSDLYERPYLLLRIQRALWRKMDKQKAPGHPLPITSFLHHSLTEIGEALRAYYLAR
jgi:hypothetical protein